MSCVFCDIVEKKVTSYVVYENQKYIAFLNKYPSVPGHTLVIPKKHVRWVYDDATPCHYWESVMDVTKLLQRTLSPSFVNYYTYGEMPHAHIHILPRIELIQHHPAPIPEGISVPGGDLKKIFEKITSV